MSDRAATRIALGTAQLGMAYGIANQSGKPAAETADAILAKAWRLGIGWIDTAQHYGDAESIIGRFLRRHADTGFRIVTKLAPSVDARDARAVVQAARGSCDALGRMPDGLLLHDSTLLAAWGDGVGAAFRVVLDQCLAGAIGVSVYTPEAFHAALGCDGITMIQAPCNVFDQRLIASGLIRAAEDAGKTIFLRSVFLQGLLLLPSDRLSRAMAFAASHLDDWHAACRALHLTPQAAALAFALQSTGSAVVVVGCETPDQLEANVRIAEDQRACAVPLEALAHLACAEPRLINPSLWSH